MRFFIRYNIWLLSVEKVELVFIARKRTPKLVLNICIVQLERYQDVIRIVWISRANILSCYGLPVG